jgi:hypothetical protein
MAKYKLTVSDEDSVLLNLIPAQPEDGYEEGTKVTINVKFGPVGNHFGTITGGTVTEVIDRAVYEVVMDAAKTITLAKEGDEPGPEPVPEAETPVITSDLAATAEIPLEEDSIELSITASVTDGGTLSYLWSKDNEPLAEETNTLTVTEAGSYKCIVTNTLGEDEASATSTVCVVTKAEE